MAVGSFIFQFLCYAVMSIVAAFIGYSVLGVIPFGPIFVVGFLIRPLMWAGPILVLAHAIRKMAAGRILGAICGLPLLFAYSEIGLQREADQIESLDQRSILPPQRSHAAVVVENAYFGMKEGAEGCSEICLQLLFDGRYAPAVKQRENNLWTVFRLVHGQACRASPQHSRYLELLGRRYADVCISASDEPPHADALVIREHFFREESDLRQQLPFRATVHEYIERIDNKDSLLSRWVTAVVEHSGFGTVFWGMRTRTIGSRFNDEDFYAATLGLPIQKTLARGDAPIRDILNELKPFFDDNEMAPWAMYAFESAASTNDPSDLALAREFMRARIADLKASHAPDPDRIRWFESWLKRY